MYREYNGRAWKYQQITSLVFGAEGEGERNSVKKDTVRTGTDRRDSGRTRKETALLFGD